MRPSVAPLALLLAACSAPPPAPVVDQTPHGAVAIAARKPIYPEAVASVAAAEHISPRDAVELLASTARLASLAESQNLHTRPDVAVARKAALARATLHAVREEVRRAPITQAELDETRREHWLDLDRPEAVRVVHAVARAAADDPAAMQRARALAQTIAEACSGATDEADFRRRAEAVPHPDVELKVETLSPVAADGRVVSVEQGNFDLAFTAAAHQLRTPLSLSPPITSAFGVHVLMLLERTPPYRPTDDQLRPLVQEEIFSRRARAHLTSLLTSLRAAHPVYVARNADEIFRELDAARGGS